MSLTGRRFLGRLDYPAEWDFCPVMNSPTHPDEIEITPEMIAAAEAVIEEALRYSTTAAAIDAEDVLRAALRARNAPLQTAKDAAKE